MNELEKAISQKVIKANTTPNGVVKISPVIREQVAFLRGRPLDPETIVAILKSGGVRITEPAARSRALGVMRKNLRTMVGIFAKQERGAPKLEALRADAPLDLVIAAYEWYQGKCIRMSGRWNEYAQECDKQLTKLRRKRAAGVTQSIAPEKLKDLREKYAKHRAG